MSQVLGFGFPVSDRLLCENPVCDERANMMAVVSAGADTTREICGCNVHFQNLITGQLVRSMTKLYVAGERNRPEGPVPPEAA